MKVLVACEFSGIVRDAFMARGHDAISCDLLDTERPGLHIKGHLEHVLNGDCGPLDYDLMIAHPPCTYLTNAGVRHLHEDVTSPRGNRAKVSGRIRWKAMEEAASFFLMIKNSSIRRICIENPIPHGYARKIIGDYTQLIQPWMFGHGETKATCLWLKNLPPLMPTHARDDLFCEQEPSERFARCHLTSPSPERWKIRSRTYQGIADAMAEQWGTLK